MKVNDKAPDFETINQNGEKVKLSNFLGKKVILYFYPKDSTPTCTTQACNLRDNYIDLKNAGYEVLGVSIDSQKMHQKFIAKYELPFDLLVDESKEIVEKYGVWKMKKLYGREYMGTARTTFIIDENGIIEEVIEKVESAKHSIQILKN